MPRDSTDPRHPLLEPRSRYRSPVRPAGYPLTDQTYAYLLHHLTATPTVAIPPGIKRDILAYYSDLSLPFATKKDPDAWAAVQKELAILQTMPINPEPVPYRTYGDGSNDDLSPAKTRAAGRMLHSLMSRPPANGLSSRRTAMLRDSVVLSLFAALSASLNGWAQTSPPDTPAGRALQRGLMPSIALTGPASSTTSTPLISTNSGWNALFRETDRRFHTGFYRAQRAEPHQLPRSRESRWEHGFWGAAGDAEQSAHR